jgi:hypothetical protein
MAVDVYRSDAYRNSFCGCSIIFRQNQGGNIIYKVSKAWGYTGISFTAYVIKIFTKLLTTSRQYIFVGQPQLVYGHTSL